jgi:hypothetical protein
MDEAEARALAIAAFDEFARLHDDGLTRADRRLINRIGDEDNGPLLGKAWQQVLKYRNSADDDQRLIKNIFAAFHLSLEAPKIPDAFHVDDYTRLRHSAEEVSAFFKSTKVDWSGDQTTVQVEQLLKSLSWATQIFAACEYNISHLPESLGLTRELKASTGPIVTFTTEMTMAMLSIFNRPLDVAVSALASIVMQSEVTVDQVIMARRHYMERNR